MFEKLKNSAFKMAVVATPFLLSACGESKDNTPQKMEIFLIPLLFITVSLIRDWRLERRALRGSR